jgi:hypothetical protein
VSPIFHLIRGAVYPLRTGHSIWYSTDAKRVAGVNWSDCSARRDQDSRLSSSLSSLEHSSESESSLSYSRICMKLMSYLAVLERL